MSKTNDELEQEIKNLRANVKGALAGLKQQMAEQMELLKKIAEQIDLPNEQPKKRSRRG